MCFNQHTQALQHINESILLRGFEEGKADFTNAICLMNNAGHAD